MRKASLPEFPSINMVCSTVSFRHIITNSTVNGAKVLCKADHVTRAILYLIDHPWLMLDEKTINSEYARKVANKPMQETYGLCAGPPKLPGRESFPNYYPFSDFAIKDMNGNILVNDDPHGFFAGGNHERFNRTKAVGFSIVYPFFIGLFPESKISESDGVEGWRISEEE